MNYPLKANDLKKELKKQKFTDIESKHPDIFNFILKKNNENKELLLEFKDIRNEKVNMKYYNAKALDTIPFLKRLEFNN